MLDALNTSGQAQVRSVVQAETGKTRGQSMPASPAGIGVPQAEAEMPGAQAQRPDPIESMEKALNNLMSKQLGSNSKLSIALDRDAGRFVYKQIDVETGKVIHQWPSEEFLRQLASLREDAEQQMPGEVLDAQA